MSKMMLLAFLGWTIFSGIGWVTIAPWLVPKFYETEDFVMNNRQNGPPVLTISNGSLIYGEDGQPRVYPDWLAQRNFRDTRTIHIFRNNAEGPYACAPINIPVEPGAVYTTTKGRQQPEDGYSLDRWTAFNLANCNLKPGHYALVTEYKIPIWGGAFTFTFYLGSNVFEILSLG